MDENVLIEDGNLRVIAERDEYPHQPEHMGWPEVLIDRYNDALTASWAGVVDLSAIERALGELGEGDTFDRWVSVFAYDLVDWEALGFTQDELDVGVTAVTGAASGYSQGDDWITVQFRPRTSTVWDTIGYDAEKSELVNWARGDAWVLVAQEYDSESDHWEDAGHCVGGYYTQWPDEDDYLKESAQDVLDEAKHDYTERSIKAAQDYYETLEVTR